MPRGWARFYGRFPVVSESAKTELHASAVNSALGVNCVAGNPRHLTMSLVSCAAAAGFACSRNPGNSSTPGSGRVGLFWSLANHCRWDSS